jgi:hypothetical protein
VQVYLTLNIHLILHGRIPSLNLQEMVHWAKFYLQDSQGSNPQTQCHCIWKLVIYLRILKKISTFSHKRLIVTRKEYSY